MDETKKRAIKMFWKLAKEKCPFQTEEIVNGYLEGFIDCAEYLLLKNTELEKENAELKQKVENQKSFLKRIKAKFNLGKLERKEIEEYLDGEQLSKAREIIRDVMNWYWETDICSDTMPQELRQNAEQFLSEVEK